MKTGAFVIDPVASNWTTIGWAELSTGFLGEPIAQITIEAPDGELYNQYWLRADPVDRCVEYLYYSEIDDAVVRDGTWPLDALDLARPDGDDDLLEAFVEMARLADGPSITELVIGMEVDALGTVDAETVSELGPLWTPTALNSTE